MHTSQLDQRSVGKHSVCVCAFMPSDQLLYRLIKWPLQHLGVDFLLHTIAQLVSEIQTAIETTSTSASVRSASSTCASWQTTCSPTCR